MTTRDKVRSTLLIVEDHDAGGHDVVPAFGCPLCLTEDDETTFESAIRADLVEHAQYTLAQLEAHIETLAPASDELLTSGILISRLASAIDALGVEV